MKQEKNSILKIKFNESLSDSSIKMIKDILYDSLRFETEIEEMEEGKYMIVEKDVENKKGFLHKRKYNNLERINKSCEMLKERLGEDYYDVFVVEVEE